VNGEKETPIDDEEARTTSRYDEERQKAKWWHSILHTAKTILLKDALKVQ
jgi:hypothetical protein